MPARDLEDVLITLDRLNIDGLREIWRDQFKTPPPPVRGPNILRLEISWRLQAARHGDLDAALRQRLERLARSPKAKSPSRSATPIGFTIVKDWNGERHSIVVLKSSYLYRDKEFASLSAIAREITGVRWSGPRFFGLLR